MVEFKIEGWPVRQKQAKTVIVALTKTHSVTPLPAFKKLGEHICPVTYKACLKGADVGVHFSLLHWPIGDLKYLTS